MIGTALAPRIISGAVVSAHSDGPRSGASAIGASHEDTPGGSSGSPALSLALFLRSLRTIVFP